MEKQPVTLIRSKIEPYTLSVFLEIGGMIIEADIRPDTQRRLQTMFNIEVKPDAGGETYDVVTIKPK